MTRTPRRLIAMRGVTAGTAACVIALAATGCGAGSGGGPVSGATVFSQACSACHSLIGNESRHRQGGDLLGYRMTRRQLTEFTREMPVRRPLSQAELAAVVSYVAAAQQQARTSH
jgi:mono/diheme cytochrome c family protein